jgi:hypothetical protein
MRVIQSTGYHIGELIFVHGARLVKGWSQDVRFREGVGVFFSLFFAQVSLGPTER